MITCTLRMDFEPGLRDEALQVLRSLKGPVRSHSGCAKTLLMHDVQNDAVITWVSRWRSRADLDGHLCSDHFRRILAVMELAAEPPHIEFECGSELRGLDLIDEIIGGADAPRHTPATDLGDNPIETGDKVP